MAFCSYSKEYSVNGQTVIESRFIKKFLPVTELIPLKVYLFGLYLCQNVQNEFTLEDMASALELTENQIIEAFKYWEDFDAVQIISNAPLLVTYVPTDFTLGKPKKIKPEKYSDFNKAIQALKPTRMITTAEFTEYFSVMEQYSIKPEAMLLIAKYCVDLKGEDISHNYILKTAMNFATEGATTVSKIEKKLSDYVSRSSEIREILSAISANRKPDIDDYNLLKKWNDELYFSNEIILYVAKKVKKGGMQKLDATLHELYSVKRFDKREIDAYLKRKNDVKNLAYQIAKELGVYCPVIDTYIDNYLNLWLAKGYEDASLIYLAKYAFRRAKNSFEGLNQLIDKLFSLGVVSLESIYDYMDKSVKEDKFIQKLFEACSLVRKPNGWDKENFRSWKSWNFSDEMILEAAKLANGKNSPIPYINSILSTWKIKQIYTLEQLAGDGDSNKGGAGGSAASRTQKTQSTAKFEKSASYSESDLEKMIDDFSDIDV